MKKRSYWVLFAVMVLVGAFLMVFLSSQNQLPVVTDVNAQMNGMGSYVSPGSSMQICNPPLIGLGIGLLVETMRDCGMGMGGIIDTEKFCSSFTIHDFYLLHGFSLRMIILRDVSGRADDLHVQDHQTLS